LVWSRGVEIAADGTLLEHILVSLYRLTIGFLVGNLLAVPIGMAIGLNRHVSDLLLPILTFLQSIAGIAWIPLAVLWFGIGDGAIIFVIANIIFFSNLYNTVIGVEGIPQVYHRAAQTLGASRRDVLLNVVLPGAFVQLIVGFRASMAFGWRALIGAELIAGTTGLGYMTLEAVQWYQTETVILGMIVVGIIWLIMDRFIFRTIENKTVRRWGLVHTH
jgi:NitT/TauT family transport system permease protein/taurine transport system permease protein